MNKKTNPLESAGKRKPFLVPDDYFEHLGPQILSQLPEQVHEPPHVPTLWERVQPWIYMAAMFGGIALMVHLFTHTSRPDATGEWNLISAADIDDFCLYYEQQSADDIYHEEMYINLE
jgi:hypothetical protein